MTRIPNGTSMSLSEPKTKQRLLRCSPITMGEAGTAFSGCYGSQHLAIRLRACLD
jgi:hypothetical protein